MIIIQVVRVLRGGCINRNKNQATAMVAGLSLCELAAVLGMSPSAVSQMLGSKYEHRQATGSVVWFLQDCPTTFVRSRLRYYMKHPPSSRMHLAVLERIAKRRLGPGYTAWARSVRAAHQHLFEE